jgi:hypothetical protein
LVIRFAANRGSCVAWGGSVLEKNQRPTISTGNR